MKSEKQLKIIRDGFQRNDEKKVKYFFSVYAIFDEDEKEIAIVEKETGAEAYDEAIAYAKENEAIEIIVVKFDKKNEPRTKKREHHFKTGIGVTKQVSEEKVIGMIEEKLSTLEETLGGMKDDPSGLGIVRQEYQHQSELLKIETRQKFKEIEFERKIEALERQIEEKEEELLQSQQETSQLKSEITELENEFENYKTDKFAGLSDQISEAGQNLLSGLVAKAIPLLTSGKGIEAMQGVIGDDAQGKTSIVEDEVNPQVDQLVTEIREILKGFNETQFQQFYQIMVYIISEPQNLENIHQFINSKNHAS